ncbi:hypothetical protein PROFUN_01794 [Planoprotostelium fungivorum]|uniref:Uncharacterized protein n=1 Tax=Planoprotostelium fungivorum TaxID=1890364 RepID=A0A2P6NYP6_9EUKA|nr:hypothetical protein PROFUN_01794 [Planoprotostelium fungivorum]
MLVRTKKLNTPPCSPGNSTPGARTICIVFVNRDIYRWNQRSLLSQKQVRKLVVMPRVELPGLHGGVFSFFVRTNIAEKRRVPGLFSQFPRVEVRKTYLEMVTKPPSNHYHQR